MSVLSNQKRHLQLCQIDGQICRCFGFSSPEIQNFVDLIPHELFCEQKREDRHLTKIHNFLQKAYDNLQVAQINLKPDDFGGYGLCYSGSASISKGQRLNVYGYLEFIPEAEERTFSNLSVMAPREGSKRSRVMVGPARFVNHCCRPNCEYLAVELNGKKAVQISAITEILYGTNLSTYYGENFFGKCNKDCKCPHVDLHRVESPVLPSEMESEKPSFELRTPAPRIQAATVLKMRNVKRRLNLKYPLATAKKPVIADLRYLSDENSEREASEVSIIEHPTRSSPCPSAAENAENIQNSPQLFDSGDDVDEDIAEEYMSDDSSEQNKDYEEKEVYEALGAGSQSSCENFVHCVESIITKHGTSDKEAVEWLQLTRLAFPNFKVPAFKTLKRRNLLRMENHIVKKKKCANGEWHVLNFQSELQEVLRRNFVHIEEYENEKKEGSDLILPRALSRDNRKLMVFLVLNTDGVKIIKSKNNSLWPIWCAVANLPPILRSSFNNILLCGLWFGTEKPDWPDFLQAVGEQLAQFELKLSDETFVVIPKPILIVADTPARYSVLNWISFNGYYGCCYCYNSGTRIGKTHYYPHQPYGMRSIEDYNADLRAVTTNPSLKSSRGVKGPSSLSKFVPNLPLSAPIDYMHQVALGVARVVLDLLRKEIKVQMREELKRIVSKIKVPFEIRRCPRLLIDLQKFKASECKDWLLYLGPPILYGKVSKEAYTRFMLLSYSIRLLLTNSCYCDEAEPLIKKFLDLTAAQYDEYCFTINVHFLNHLCWQVRNYGPLWCTSAFMFESANHLLSRPFTGTVNHLDHIIERYLRRKKLLSTKLKKDNLVGFAQTLGNTSKEFIERRVVDETALPLHYNPDDDCLRSTMQVNCLKLDSLTYSTNANAYISFEDCSVLKFGEIVVFEKSENSTCLVNLFNVKQTIGVEKCSAPPDVISFVVVEYSAYQQEVFVNSIKNKLVRIDVDDKVCLSVLLDHFEHD